jgi:hypothetical protein
MQQDPIIQALCDQVGCYRRLAKLAEVQHQYVQNSQTEGLLDVLQKRQTVLDQLALLEAQIAPAKQRWSDYLGRCQPQARQQAEALMAETRTLLEQITAADRDDVMVLQQQKLNVGRQLQQTTCARQLNRSYARAAYGKVAPRMDLQR